MFGRGISAARAAAKSAERREKASKISVQAAGRWRQPGTTSPTVFFAHIRNTGDSVFGEVHAIASWRDGVERSFVVGEVPPNAGLCTAEVGLDGPEPADYPVWRIEYTDVHGLRWRHSSNGELVRTVTPPRHTPPDDRHRPRGTRSIVGDGADPRAA